MQSAMKLPYDHCRTFTRYFVNIASLIHFFKNDLSYALPDLIWISPKWPVYQAGSMV